MFIVHKNTPSNNLHERVAEGNGVHQQLDFKTFYGVFMDQLYGLQLPDELSRRLEAKRALEFAAEIVACWCTPSDRSVSLLNDTGLYSKPNKKARFVKACDYAFRSWHTLQDNRHQLYMVMAGHYARESFVDVMDTLLSNIPKLLDSLLQALYHVKSPLPQVYSSWTAFLLECYVLSVCFSPECGLLRILSANARLSLPLNLHL